MKARAVLLMLLLTVGACGSPQPSAPQPARQMDPIAKPPLTLLNAIRRSTDLGPAGPGTSVDLNFGLRTPRPDAALVDRAVQVLNEAGLRSSWRAPSSLILADGPAPAASALLGVQIEDYRMPDGTTFYVALQAPRMPAAIAAVSTDISGLDNYPRMQRYAIRAGGLTPVDVVSLYNLKPLRDAGLDGAGQTILVPEIDDMPNLNDVDKFASKFGLPAFDQLVTTKRDPSWGTPEKPAGETVLDLEVLHEVAPAAKIVVYFSAPDFGHSDRAFDQMVTDHLGSIISESLGSCEVDTPGGARNTYASIQDRAVALGMTHLVASGDAGAYTCGLDQSPAASFPSTLPSVTAVGGTSVFQSAQGAYYQEYAWGSPIDQSGGGGGASQFYGTPDYQRSEAQPGAHGEREVPDVAADADPSTGFHIVFQGHDDQAGGTSAATPLWAATVALINQDLKQKGMREVGFANPAIYWMGENSTKLNPRPFHDVTAGNNLFYDAGSGWDFATGWGSMDAAALDAAWMRYLKSGGS
ncbi:MAG TPA: S53 family peptidase [Candidatus Dormibacteraeota bacterium]|nr:S53 family peptidase [Candidatus Dormibacteraeota bacterium]